MVLRVLGTRYWLMVSDLSLTPFSTGRDSKWTTGIAVGSEMYIDEIKNRLGIKATGRNKIKTQDAFELREPTPPYNDTFTREKDILRTENMQYWNIYPIKSED